MTEAQVRELIALLGMAGAPLKAALERIVERAKGSPAACYEIKLILQGGQVVEIVPPPEKWRLLGKRQGQ